jgi:hypothetical protein
MRGIQEQVTSRKPFPTIRPGAYSNCGVGIECFVVSCRVYICTPTGPLSALSVTPYTLHLTTLKCRGKDGETTYVEAPGVGIR